MLGFLAAPSSRGIKPEPCTQHRERSYGKIHGGKGAIIPGVHG